MSQSPRILGTVSHYAQLLDLIRTRVAELEITHETLDHVAGLQPGYASKLLCEPPMRRMGPLTLFLVLDALGMSIMITTDPVSFDRVRSRLTKRRTPRRRLLSSGKQGPVIIYLERDFLRQIASKGGLARTAKLGSLQRQAIAQQGGLARAAKLSPQRRQAIARKASAAALARRRGCAPPAA